LEKAVQPPYVLAIGEIGLDRAKGPAMPIQTAWFEAQLKLAEKVNKPVIVHCVKAYADLIPFLKKYTMPFILHGYNGNRQQTSDLLKFPQIYFSLGKQLFSAGNQKMDAFLAIPTQRVFLETDTSGIPIREMYATYSRLSGIPQEEIRQTLRKNYMQITDK
jgi:TatD DNase family protein